MIDLAPNATTYTRWSCHSGLAFPVQMVSTPTATAMGARLPFFWGKPVMRTLWMAGTAPHKSGRCRDESDKHTQTCLDLRYLPHINRGYEADIDKLQHD